MDAPRYRVVASRSGTDWMLCRERWCFGTVEYMTPREQADHPADFRSFDDAREAAVRFGLPREGFVVEESMDGYELLTGGYP